MWISSLQVAKDASRSPFFVARIFTLIKIVMNEFKLVQIKYISILYVLHLKTETKTTMPKQFNSIQFNNGLLNIYKSRNLPNYR